jgi:hypothetical protein
MCWVVCGGRRGEGTRRINADELERLFLSLA